ncbi:pyridoxal-phosphate dependent enzyme [bacterium]|nr:MAG: pyridoxal-phosphate dependent enzyme [bacterium]
MSKIIKKINHAIAKKTAARCKKHGITIPTFAQMRNPDLIPDAVKKQLPSIGLWDINPLNLYRITWKNDIKSGGFGGVNYFEIPKAITGVNARIIGIIGKYFPTGAHKVGAAFGCLVPRLVSGEFDPDVHKAVWPSTGNYCRGGAFDCRLLDCTPIAILPEGMSKERFTWLKGIGAEVIATPGTESNVKEIYDKCWELREDPLNIIFNQFDEFGNPIWHYNVTGPALQEAFQALGVKNGRASAYISATGSAGTIGAGDYLKKIHPNLKIVASEALQCPTLLMNGFGEHRIEGIGDKHIPWVHNVRNTDTVSAIDDEDCMRVFRLFNEPEGQKYLKSAGVTNDELENLKLMGISSVSNMLSAIKTAKHFEFNSNDVILTIFTDGADMYHSRIDELKQERGAYTSVEAAKDHAAPLMHQGIDYYKELSYYDKKTIHNLKYFTWIEQQGKSSEELRDQWEPEYWRELFEDEVAQFDKLITEFNAMM